MNSINGRILHSGTGLGIQNLIVTVYDLDPKLPSSESLELPESQLPSSGEDTTWNPNLSLNLLADLRRFLSDQQNLETYLQLIYFGGRGFDQEEDPFLKTYFGIAGDRIGSVLTDEKGEFSLSYDDDAFRIRDEERRPDLVLFVLAPEYSRQITLPSESGETAGLQPGTQLFPVPDLLRVLHFTVFPRRNAGRLESSIIKLNTEQLEAQNIAVPSSAGSEVDFAQVIQADANRKNRIRLDLREVRRNKLTKHREIEQASQIFVQNLSAVPRTLRQSPLFIRRDEDVEQAKIIARQSGTTRIAPHSNFARANIRLSASDLVSLGITSDFETFRTTLSRDGSITYNLELDDICDFFQRKNGGTELTRRVTSLLKELRAGAHRNNDENVNPGSSEGEGSGSTGSEISLSAEEQIKQIVLKRVQAISPSDPEQEGFSEDQVQQINRTIKNLAPPASPADVTAFYDFQHLQIAFPDVWTEAFDGKVSELMRRMDVEYREYTDELDVERDPSESDPSELQDLNDYTRLMGKLIGDVASLGNEPPMSTPVRDLLTSALSSRQSESSNLGVRRVGDRIIVRVRSAGSVTDTSERRSSLPNLDQIWQTLSIAQKEELIKIATNQIKREVTKLSTDADSSGIDFKAKIISLLDRDNADLVNAGINLLREAKQISKTSIEPISQEEKEQLALEIISNPEGRVTRVQKILEEIEERLHEPHSFRVFRKNTVNFGVVTTYRQEWQPGSYQVGGLVSSLPLTPGETRRYSKKEMIKISRSEKENKKYASTIQDERNITSRATSDIVEKASTTTNFEQSLQTQLSGSIKLFSIGANTNTGFSRNQAVESQKTKNSFHEAIRKASQEYKDERSLEISTEEVGEFESTFSSEISNPNNEITVTYLFYELERQYRVTEHLHKLTPVVLVAQEVPNPADIDEDWLLAHEWILRRVLLDISFNDALDYLADGLIGDEVATEVMREHYETQKALVEDLGTTVETLTSLQDSLRDTLVQTSGQEKLAKVAQKRAKKRRRRRILRRAFGIPPIPSRLASGASSLAFGNRTEDPAVLEARREALETRLEFLEGNLEDARSQLTTANSALAQASAELTEAIQESFTKRNLVNQFRIHIKDNILYYMQMIWSYEHSDQRYFRLYDVPVEIPMPEQPRGSGGSERPTRARITFREQNRDRKEGIYNPLLRNRGLDNEICAQFTLSSPTVDFEKKALHEIADLDNLMGFKGNYMIFPLKQCTYITDFMMQDYIDDYFGLRDPDPVGDFSTDELLEYSEELYHSDQFSDAEKQEARAAINRLVQERLTSPRIDNELIVVPTGQLFIEALKGEHALLENYKLLHRQLDVQKVEEEVRMAQLENLRHAMRLTQSEPLLDDSDVDRKIVIEGNGSGVIIPSEG